MTRVWSSRKQAGVKQDVYQTAFEWFDIAEGVDYVIPIVYTYNRGKTAILSIRREKAGAKYMAENNIKPFPVSLLTLVEDYMDAHPEINWYDCKRAED